MGIRRIAALIAITPVVFAAADLALDASAEPRPEEPLAFSLGTAGQLDSRDPVSGLEVPQHVDDVLLRIPPDEFVQALMDSTSLTRITATVQRLQDFVTRYVVTDSCWAAGHWIRDQFTGYGYEDVRIDTFRTLSFQDSVDAINVTAYKQGSTRPSEYVIIGGHYDSVTWQNIADPNAPAPGADDNASGVAGVLEAARLLEDVSTERSVIFACWSAEEQGLWGSRDFVAKAVAQGLDIVLYINMDCIGYNDFLGPDGVIQADSSAVAVGEYMCDLAGSIGYDLYAMVQPLGASDHTSFWEAGYNVVDTGTDPGSPYRHTADDVIDNMDLNLNRAMAAINVVATAAVAGVVGEDPNLPPATVLVENCASTHSLLTLRPRFEWAGVDFDGEIWAYEYRLSLPGSDRPGTEFGPNEATPERSQTAAELAQAVLVGPQLGRWTELPASQTSITLEGLPPDDYTFEVRAVDDDHASDLTPASHRFATRDTLRPELTVATDFLAEPRTFVRSWTPDDEVPVRVFSGELLKFEISGSAECYCGIADSVAYALGDTLAWSAWMPSPLEVPFRPTPGDTTIYFRTRDENLAVTTGKMVFTLVDAPMDVALLRVDDWLDPFVPEDEHDAFYELLLDEHEHDTWDPLDHIGPGGPELPSMEELGRYRTVLWTVDVNGGFLRDEREESGYHYLEGFVRAGGNVILEGFSPLWALVDADEFVYELTFEPGGFVHDHAGIDSAKNAGPYNAPTIPEYHGYAFLGGISAGVPGYVDVPVDTLVKWAENYALYGGLPSCEIVRPTDETARLYLFDAYVNYTLDEKPCATIHFPREGVGTFAFLGFPLYYLQTAPASVMIDRLLGDIQGWQQPSELVFFSWDALADSVAFIWYLDPPDDPLGCNIERKEGPVSSPGEYVRINDDPIRVGEFNRYAFVDPGVVPSTTYSYRLDVVERWGGHTSHGPWEVTTAGGHVVDSFSRALANPFTDEARFRFGVGTNLSRVSIDVYDVSGRLVTNLVDEPMLAGEHDLRWNGTDASGKPVASGIYFVRALVGHSTFERKLVRLR